MLWLRINYKLQFRPPLCLWHMCNCNLMKLRILIEHAFIKYLGLHSVAFCWAKFSKWHGWVMDIHAVRPALVNSTQLKWTELLNTCACSTKFVTDNIVTDAYYKFPTAVIINSCAGFFMASACQVNGRRSLYYFCLTLPLAVCVWTDVSMWPYALCTGCCCISIKALRSWHFRTFHVCN